jgi:hypothetical protein
MLAVVMVLSCFVCLSTTAFAANTTVSTYEELVNAVSLSSNGDTVFISAPITISQDTDFGSAGKTITIKSAVANGHLITIQDCVVSFSNIKFTGSEFQNTTMLNIKTGSSTTFTDCLFENINATSMPIVIDTNDINTFTRCTFKGNSGVSCGVVSAANSGVIFNYCSFENNTSTVGSGAIRYATTNASYINKSLTINNTPFKGNSGSLAGAVLVTGNSATATANANINTCVITGNSSATGGGISSENASITLADTLVYGNTATTKGADYSFSNTTLTYSCQASLWDTNGVQLAGYYTDEADTRYSAAAPTAPYTLATASGITQSIAAAYSSLSCGLTVGTATVQVGGTIQVPVTISDNGGVACIACQPTFDSTNLTLTGVESSIDSGSFYYNSENNKFIWYDTTDYTGEGEAFVLTFETSATTTEDDYNIGLNYSANDICNSNGDTVSLDITPGVITVFSFVLGDANGDLDVTAADVVYLARYIIGLETTIDSNAADVNNDGAVDGRDVVFLARVMVGLETLEG